MICSLDNPIQCEDNALRVDLRPKLYDPNNNNSQSINFPYGTSIPVDYYGVLPWIAVLKPTKYEVENCEWIALTSKFYLDSYVKGGSFSKVEAHSNDIESVLESFEDTDLISSELSCLILGAMISDTTVFHQSNNTAKKKRDNEDMYCAVSEVRAKSLPSLSPEKLSRMWGIGLKTAIKTLETTTHKCISSTGLL